MHHSDFIGILTSIYQPNNYLELGLYKGETLLKVLPYVKNAVAVDMILSNEVKDIKNPKVEKYECDTNTFFQKWDLNKRFDFIFIDADHCYESALHDFINSTKILNRDGVIVMHDTNPIDNRYFDKGYCGDSYKIVPLIENTYKDDYNIYTLPLTEAGLSIITLKNSTRTIIRNE